MLTIPQFCEKQTAEKAFMILQQQRVLTWSSYSGIVSIKFFYSLLGVITKIV